jgi:hypothetical protein
MKARPTSLWIAGLLLVLAACASSGAGGGAAENSTVQQWIDITNQTSEPVAVTARVGAGAVQPLGFFGPAEYRRVKIDTGASTTDEIYLEARNDQTGNHATSRLKVIPAQTLRWDIQF